MQKLKDIELFEKDRFGRLMKIQEDPFTRYQFEIWFEYTRQAMMGLKEGTFLAAKNFASDDNIIHYSVLELTSIKPVHYALGNNPDGYPGFVMEAAKNIAIDWTTQESESSEDTTIIQCIATPTEIEIQEMEKDRKFSPDRSVPMIGTDVKVITSEITEKIINRDIQKEENLLIEAGKWLVDSSTPIYLNVEDLLRVHFGIFGFTKAGKSNLLSTLIGKLIESAEKKKKPIKIVIFDLMSEYNILLIDILNQLDTSYLIGIGENTFPGSLIQLFQNKPVGKQPILDILNTSLYPQELLEIKPKFEPIIENLIESHKIRILQPSKILLRDYIKDNREILSKKNPGNIEQQLFQFTERIIELDGDREISSTLLKDVRDAVDRIILIATQTPSTAQTTSTPGQTLIAPPTPITTPTAVPTSQTSHRYLANINFTQNKLTSTARNNLDDFKTSLNIKIFELDKAAAYSQESIITPQRIIIDINDSTHSSLYIIQSHDPDELRKFAHDFGRELFENRRRNGIINPLASFIFDEADEFIPRDPPTTSHQMSVDVAHMLARRGRKFGIGIGIATQRTRYLNTSIMAQPHTYLVSKLPRSADRQVVQEAFGFSDEIFAQTFKFLKGDWLLASYDATGLTGVPIPIHAENANDRIKAALDVKK